ncbi:MAG: oligopeptide/dipeptide ABC transporter ATP-binding protein [Euryarchaeota archaeon]|nr:oligopeptide/dipeptide ABC transporter ATP-binding protein [Euryarchaeota archaeon]
MKRIGITRYGIVYALLMVFIVLLNIGYSPRSNEHLEENYEPFQIALDNVHGNAKNDLSKLKNNFSCEQIPFFPITSKVLSNYNLLIISTPKNAFYSSEIEAIESFVKEGGDLIVMGGRNLNPLLSMFGVNITGIKLRGMSYLPQRPGEKSCNFKLNDLEENELTKNIDSLYFKETTLISGDFDLTASRIYYYGIPRPSTLVGVKKHGHGRLLVVGSFLDPIYEGNRVLIKNFMPPEKFKNREKYNALYSYQKMVGNLTRNGDLDRALTLENAWNVYFKGDVPTPSNPPAGCRFHPRCKYAKEQCKSEVPPLRDMGDGHLVACHYPLDQ